MGGLLHASGLVLVRVLTYMAGSNVRPWMYAGLTDRGGLLTRGRLYSCELRSNALALRMHRVQ